MDIDLMKDENVINNIFDNIKELVISSRNKVYTAVNTEMLKLYWNIGKSIIEIQQGDERASYGDAVLEKLSQKLTDEFGKGFSKRNLERMRKFYIYFPIATTVSSQLSWSHYLEILKIEEELKRNFYIKETINSKWSVRELQRQIGSLLYERLTLSANKEKILELDEKAQHSGRCCPAEINPDIPYVAYEDGFAVLANYERFRGGRKANVEVHGGATLEEVVVPVITISRKPENIEYCFTNPIIILKQKDVATLTLYCNIPMNKPRILVNQTFYDGEFVADQKHAKFVMPELKRSREYIAEIYDGDTSLSVSLKFKIQKSMGQEVDLLA